jgi:putative ABC transport system permease protein
MQLRDTLRMARDNLSRARLRTTLTTLGVAIGTAAVVTLVAVGIGTRAWAVSQANTFGTLTTAIVLPQDATSRTLTPKSNGQPTHVLTPSTVRTVAHLAAVRQVTGLLTLPPLRLQAGTSTDDLAAVGVAPLADVRLSGVTLVTPLDPDTGDGVLVPDTAARTLGLSPGALLGRHVTLTAGGDVCCAAAGSGLVVASPAQHLAARVIGGSLAARMDGRVRCLSAATYLNRLGYDLLVVDTNDARRTPAIARTISAWHYQVLDRSDLLAQLQTAFAVLTAVLGGVGGIALLVAAIGIANTLIVIACPGHDRWVGTRAVCDSGRRLAFVTDRSFPRNARSAALAAWALLYDPRTGKPDETRRNSFLW